MKALSKLKKSNSKKSTKSVDLMQYSSIVFGLGILIMLIATILPAFFDSLSDKVTQIIAITLIIIGLIIGYMNVTSKEAVRFMIAMLLVVMLTQPFLGSIVQAFGLQGNFTALKVLGNLYVYINTLFVPAAVVVALRTVFQTAKDE